MTNGSPNEFVDRIYSCQDTVFIYKGIKYWFQGYMPSEYSVHMEIFQYQPPDEKWLWKYDGKNIEECQQAFLSAHIFDGRTFWEAEQEIEWVDS